MKRKEKEMLGIILVWLAAIDGMIMLKKMKHECFLPYAVYAVTIATTVTVLWFVQLCLFIFTML